MTLDAMRALLVWASKESGRPLTEADYWVTGALVALVAVGAWHFSGNGAGRPKSGA